MSWADIFDGTTLMAVEIAGTVLLSLALVCAVGVLLLCVFVACELLQALLRYAVRQLRIHAFEIPREASQ